MTRYTEISLSAVAGLVEREMVEYAESLRPGDEPEAIVVERLPSGSYDLVDGFHRVAGYRRWADEGGRMYDSIMVRALLTEAGDEDDAARAAAPGPEQDAALRALRSRAK